MTQQSHFWAYTPRKPELKETSVLQCSALFMIQFSHLFVTPSWEALHETFAKIQQVNKAPVFVKILYFVQFSSVTKSCLTLCNPMNHSMPGLPVHHQHPEFTQTHVQQVGDAIHPSHPLLSPSPPAPNPSQHQSLFQWVNSSHEVAKVLEFQL